MKNLTNQQKTRHNKRNMNFQTRISGHQRVKGAEYVALATNVDTKQLTAM